MKNQKKYIDPEDPEQVEYSIPPPSDTPEFTVPTGYFNDVEDQLRAEVRFEKKMDLEVPGGYFEDLHLRITRRIQDEAALPSKSTVRHRSAQWIPWALAAAAAVVAGLILLPSRPSPPDSFSQLLEKTHFTSEEMASLAETDEIIDRFGDEILAMDDDTVVTTSPPVAPAIDSTPAPATPPGNVKQPATPPAVTFDDLSNEEILNYLIEEGSDDLFDDL